MKKSIKATLAFMIAGSALYAQTVADANKAIDAEQYQKAKSTLKSIVAAQPANAEAYFQLGQVYLKTDYPDSAKAVFQRGVSADPKSGLNYIGLGSLDLEAGNAAAAKANFDKAASMAGKKDNKPLLYIGKAYTQASKPDYQAAITYLQKAKALNEKDAEVVLALADAHRGTKDLASAYSEYRAAFDMDKSLLRSKVELGVMNKKSRAWQESADAFNSVIALNPSYGPAYRELADTYYWWADAEPKTYDEKIKQALQYYEKYMDLTDRSLDSRMKHADFLILTKDYKALEQEAQEMSKLDKTNPRIFRYLGYAAYENGNYPASVQAINDFLSKTTKPIAQDYMYLGQAQMKSGAEADGMTNLKKAATMDSTLAGAFSEIGLNLYKARNYEKAKEAYEIAIKNPKSKTMATDYAYLGRSYYYDYLGKSSANANPSKDLLVKADSTYSYLNKNYPTFAEAHYFRGAIVLRQNTGNTDAQANAAIVPHFQKYVELMEPKISGATLSTGEKAFVIDALNNLGAYFGASDAAKAKEYFTKSLTLDPANKYASDNIKQLSASNK